MENLYLDNIKDFILSYGYFFIFFFLFLESFFLTCFIVPGTIILILSGYYSYQGDLNLFFVFFFGFIGTIVGDNVSYLFGRFIIKNISKFNKINYFLSINKEKIIKNTIWFIFFFHFFPLSRASIPLILGFLKFKFLKWFFIDFFSTTFFCIFFIFSGFLFGHSLKNDNIYYLNINHNKND